MIFIVAQFYLTQILSGKDESLARLNQQVAELTDLLSLERDANAELRVTVPAVLRASELDRGTGRARLPDHPAVGRPRFPGNPVGQYGGGPCGPAGETERA